MAQSGSEERKTLTIKEAEIWYEMTVIEEMISVYIEYGSE